MHQRQKSYSRTFDESATAVAFPLGGIGTGNVSLGARGELRDWEIFNRPQGQRPTNTFFAIRAQVEGARLYHAYWRGKLQPPHILSHGYHPTTAAGLPRCRKRSSAGNIPFAHVAFEDPTLPVQVELEAFTPLVRSTRRLGHPLRSPHLHSDEPHGPSGSSYPRGVFNEPCSNVQFDRSATSCPTSTARTVNTYRDEGALRGLYMSAEGLEPKQPALRQPQLVTDHPTSP
jgi:hypothetical protein